MLAVAFSYVPKMFLQVRSLKEIVAPVRVFPAMFLFFSTFYIVAVVSYAHEEYSQYWVTLDTLMYMFMSTRGILFFIAFFW